MRRLTVRVDARPVDGVLKVHITPTQAPHSVAAGLQTSQEVDEHGVASFQLTPTPILGYPYGVHIYDQAQNGSLIRLQMPNQDACLHIPTWTTREALLHTATKLHPAGNMTKTINRLVYLACAAYTAWWIIRALLTHL